MSTYAIIESGGKQYRVAEGDSLVVDRLREGEGSKVDLRAVFFRGDGDKMALDGADLDKVKVEAVVAEHLRGEKIWVIKHRPKKGYRRRAGHRSELTRLEVTGVRMLSRKPAAQKSEKPAGGARKGSATTGKAPAKKAAAKRTTKKGS